jgi:hypothetical protein
MARAMKTGAMKADGDFRVTIGEMKKIGVPQGKRRSV